MTRAPRRTPAQIAADDLAATEACDQHRGLCAFTGTEPDRCPWCHARWPVIVDSGWHSCESMRAWPVIVDSWRVAEARRMRLEAALGVDSGASTPVPVSPAVPGTERVPVGVGGGR